MAILNRNKVFDTVQRYISLVNIAQTNVSNLLLYIQSLFIQDSLYSQA